MPAETAAIVSLGVQKPGDHFLYRVRCISSETTVSSVLFAPSRVIRRAIAPESDRGMDNSDPSAGVCWHVLYTKPHCEAQVQMELTAEGMQVFLPVLPAVALRRGRPAFRSFFPCYLFARFDL